MDYTAHGRQVLGIELDALAGVRDSLGDSFADAVRTMLAAATASR